MLPAEKFPHLATRVNEMMTGDGDQRFEFGLDMLIRSLATYTSSDVSAGDA